MSEGERAHNQNQEAKAAHVNAKFFSNEYAPVGLWHDYGSFVCVSECIDEYVPQRE